MEGDDQGKIAAINALRPGIHYRHGTRRPYRPCPADFAETFARLGWSKDLNEHYRCSDAVLWRWINEAGADTLKDARAAASKYRYPRIQRRDLRTYTEAVAAIMRGDEVPAAKPIPPGRPLRLNDDLHRLAIERGYRLRSARGRYIVCDQLDRTVVPAAPVETVRQWLEAQPVPRR